MIKSKFFAFSILTGICIGTSNIPFPPWALFFCYVPLWLVWVEAKSLKQVFIAGWIAQFVLILIGFNWVMHTVHEFGHLPWWLSVLALLGYCSFTNLNIPIAGMIWYWLFRNSARATQVIALVTLTSITERLYPMIFDWHSGYTWLWVGWPAYQLADIFGFFGLSTITIILNGVVLWAYFQWKAGKSYQRPIAAGLAIFLVLNLLGYWRGQSLPKPDRVAKVLVVQANISNSDKEYAEHGGGTRDFIVRKFFDLTGKALEDVKAPIDFAIWPETAFPDVLADPGLSVGFPARLREFLAGKKLALVTGGYSLVGGRLTNAMIALNDQGHFASPPYSKTYLLAFGEYLPGSVWFPKLKDLIPEIADFGRGSGPQILRLGDINLGGQICYEGTIDRFSRELAQKGAQIIVNSTNDSWYPDWNEPYQHLYVTFARAIETRRPLVRSTNTGISSVILANGQILDRSPRGVEWSHLYEIPYLENPPNPPFLSWGYYLFPAILAITLAVLIIRRRKT